jgi:hypothetical protein
VPAVWWWCQSPLPAGAGHGRAGLDVAPGPDAAAGLDAVPLLSQVTEKSSPLAMAAGVASVAPGRRDHGQLRGPAPASAALFIIALAKFTVPKLDSGNAMFVSLGASAMISAEPS